MGSPNYTWHIFRIFIKTAPEYSVVCRGEFHRRRMTSAKGIELPLCLTALNIFLTFNFTSEELLWNAQCVEILTTK